MPSEALQLVRSSIGEPDAASGRGILSGRGNQDLTASGGLHHTRGDVDRRTANIVTTALDVPDMDPRMHIHTEGPDCRDKSDGTSDGVGGRPKGGEQPVAHVLDQPTAESRDLLGANALVLVQQLTPATVAELASAFGRRDDIREQHRGQDPLDVAARATPVMKASNSS